jgi:hypothetical protein
VPLSSKKQIKLIATVRNDSETDCSTTLPPVWNE